MKIRWLDIALQDLDEIVDFISTDNPEAAERMVSRLWSATQRLAAQPDMGRPGRVYGTREWVVDRTPFILPYRVSGGEIQILRVLHGARKWPGTF